MLNIQTRISKSIVVQTVPVCFKFHQIFGPNLRVGVPANRSPDSNDKNRACVARAFTSLCSAVCTHGEKDAYKISKLIPPRGRQCYPRCMRIFEGIRNRLYHHHIGTKAIHERRSRTRASLALTAAETTVVTTAKKQTQPPKHDLDQIFRLQYLSSLCVCVRVSVRCCLNRTYACLNENNNNHMNSDKWWLMTARVSLIGAKQVAGSQISKPSAAERRSLFTVGLSELNSVSRPGSWKTLAEWAK